MNNNTPIADSILQAIADRSQRITPGDSIKTSAVGTVITITFRNTSRNVDVVNVAASREAAERRVATLEKMDHIENIRAENSVVVD